MDTNAFNVVCEGGICRLVDAPDGVVGAADTAADAVARLAQGYMPADQFIAFYIEQYAALIPESVLNPDFFNPHVIEGDVSYLLITLGLSSFDEMIAEIRALQRKGLILGEGTGVLQCSEFVSYVTYKL